MASTRLFITGISGYLGGDVAWRAARSGWEVSGCYLTRPPSSGEGLQLDVRDAEAFGRALDEMRPDCVINTAYRQGGGDEWTTNADGAGIVAAAASRVGARVIHVSSDLVFDGRLGRPYREDDAPSPITDYGRSKLAGEQLVAEAAPAALIVRTSLLYGGRQSSNHERLALDAVEGSADVGFFTDEVRSPVAVGDLAESLLDLSRLELAGPLHVAGADAVSRYEFASLVVTAHGFPAERLRRASTEDADTPRPTYCALDSSRAAGLVGRPLRGVHKVLETTQI
jgi:dTDP-4-dehydrorhamnose reductase